MCKTTKGNQSASQCRLLSVQPNQAGGGPGGGGGSPSGTTPAPPRFDGIPENVPDANATFIVEPRIAADDFINGAITYHTNMGLQPQQIHSLGHMVELLSGAASRLRKVRLVTHASGDDLIVPLFGQTNVQVDRHAIKEHIRGFAESDERGILSILGLRPGQHFFGWSISTVMSFIRTANAALLTPFGLNASGLPPDNLNRFMLYCCDRAFVVANRVRRNGGNLGAQDRADLLSAIDTLINLAVPPSTAGSPALRTFITGSAIASLGVDGTQSYNYTVPGGAMNLFWLAGRAAEAVNAGFRTQLTTVRNRLDENSIFDIRGCRAGQDRDYLRAVQEFFGRSGHRPTVTGPRWYQYFGPCAFPAALNTNANIHALLHNGANAANTRAAFEQWAERSQVNERHKAYWLERLDGSVIRFCLMEWRSTFPQLVLQTPGLTAFAAMNFTAAIARIGVFLNVPNASVPSGATLNTINTLVTTKLSGYADFLLATVDEANKVATFTGLSQIDQELSLTLVPDTQPDPLSVDQVRGFQTALIDHLEANQLLAIKNFMTVCKNRIEDANDPGMYYYMLNAGMPVFLFSNREVVNNHAVNVANNRIVVHNDFSDAAFRQWPPMLWAEPLPAGNSIGTMQIGNVNARRFAMMVELPTGGNSPVAACPHPDYNDKIETVTNTPDPF